MHTFLLFGFSFMIDLKIMFLLTWNFLVHEETRVSMNDLCSLSIISFVLNLIEG